MVALLRWAVGGTLVLLFAWLAVLNACAPWTWYVRKREHPSWTPLLGGVSGAIGIWVLPLEAAHRWWWVPLVLDWGSLPGIAHALMYHLLSQLKLARRRDPMGR